MTIRRGDILWADLGMFPTTSVQGGVRPVIVVSNNKANTYSSVITVVPLTSRIYKKRYLPTHVFISKYDMIGIRKGSLALAEQVMSISTKCIIEKCGRVNKWSLETRVFGLWSGVCIRAGYYSLPAYAGVTIRGIGDK